MGSWEVQAISSACREARGTGLPAKMERVLRERLRGHFRRAEDSRAFLRQVHAFRKRWPAVHASAIRTPTRPPRVLPPRKSASEAEKFVGRLSKAHLQFVSYGEFWQTAQTAFRRLARRISSASPKEKFAVVVEEGKSSEWMALLFIWWCETHQPDVAEAMTSAKGERFQYLRETVPAGASGRTTIIVDDVSYSGAQISHMSHRSASCVNPVVVCIPWTSTAARRLLRGADAEIISVRKFPTVMELLGCRGPRDLVEKYGLYQFKYKDHGFTFRGTILDAISDSTNVTLTMFEHKHSDATSLPRWISEIGCRKGPRGRGLFVRRLTVDESALAKIPVRFSSDELELGFPVKASSRWKELVTGNSCLIDYALPGKIYRNVHGWTT